MNKTKFSGYPVVVKSDIWLVRTAPHEDGLNSQGKVAQISNPWDGSIGLEDTDEEIETGRSRREKTFQRPA